MIRFISVQTRPYQGQNNLDILVDNQVSQQYFIDCQNLTIEAEFGNTLIQEINLHLYPETEKDILYKCYNLNELDQEYKRISGKFIKLRKEENYIIYTALIKSEVPFTRLTITIQSDNTDSFKIYYFGVRGKNIEEESQQQESIEKKNIKVILKPARKTENFNNRIVDNDKMTPSEFFNRVKSGIPISNREQQSQNINFQNYDEKMKIEKTQINDQNIKFMGKILEESKVKDEPESRKYITLYDDDENSVQFIEEKVKQQQQQQQQLQQQQQQNNKNHFYSQKCCFSDTKPNSINKIHTKQLNITKFTTQQKSTANQDTKVEYNIFHNMIKYTASEIDQEFLQFHKIIEENNIVPAKYRLIHRLNTQQY